MDLSFSAVLKRKVRLFDVHVRCPFVERGTYLARTLGAHSYHFAVAVSRPKEGVESGAVVELEYWRGIAIALDRAWNDCMAAVAHFASFTC